VGLLLGQDKGDDALRRNEGPLFGMLENVGRATIRTGDRQDRRPHHKRSCAALTLKRMRGYSVAMPLGCSQGHRKVLFIDHFSDRFGRL